jgi:anti-sigma-K factor RskA
MSEMSEHEQIEISVAAYILGAAEPGEADLVRAHLDACSSCQELATRLRRAASVLPLGVEEARPPDRLRERILRAAAAPARPASAEPRRARILRLPRRPRPVWRGGQGSRRPIYAAVAALAIAVVALGAWDGYLTTRLQQSAADRTTIQGQGSMAGSQAQVIRLRREGVTLVEFKGMRQLDSNKSYVLWLIPADGHPVNAAAFRPDPDGTKLVVLSQELSGYSQIAVTVEDSPDVKAPSQTPELGGRLA